MVSCVSEGRETRLNSIAPLIQDFRYRREVDGLRAIAVLTVILFHAELGVPGGYVGVDVFFVISGYLITSLILSELHKGSFTLANFWARRARRIVPALVTVVLASFIAGWFILLPKDFTALGKSAAYQAVFGANIYFWKATGYFATPHAAPLLHTWSLAVEEQFYFFFPLILSALFLYFGARTRHKFILIFAVGVFASLFASIYVMAHFHTAAFFLLPTRAWELLIGSSLAVLPSTCLASHRPLREITSYVGLVGILVPCFIYTSATPFPGLAALPPCLGTALIIWANGPFADGTSTTSLKGLLASRPAVFVGLISYSLYLWHWPILAFGRYYFLEPQTAGRRLAMIGIAFLLAIVSWRFIESPFRRRSLCSSRKSIYGFAATTLATSFALGLILIIMHGFPQRMPKHLWSSDPQDDFQNLKEMTTADIVSGNLLPLGVRGLSQPTSVLLWGDSHAMAALPAFDELLRRRGVFGQAAIHTATAPVLGYYLEAGQWGLNKEALNFNAEVVSYVERRHIPNVVMVAFWSQYTSGISVPTQPSTPGGSWPDQCSSLRYALLATVKKLVSVGSQPWILLQVPTQPYDVPRLLLKVPPTTRDLNEGRFCAKPGPYNGISGNDSGFLVQLKKAGARVIDPRSAFLDSKRDLYRISMNGVILYRDSNHLTESGSKMILIPFLEESFSPFLVSGN
jgi:peptidoglycan/LPS O-acetylase OafA/YrhL